METDTRFESQRLIVERRDSIVHRVLAARGPYRVIGVLNPVDSKDTVGLVCFARANGLEFFAWQPPLIQRPPDLPPELPHMEALALGPIYREADSSWIPLAGLPATWFDASLQIIEEVGPILNWLVESRVYGGPTLVETFHLRPEGLEYQCNLLWSIPGFAVQLPVLLCDGQRRFAPSLQGRRLCLPTASWQLVAECEEPDDVFWTLQAVMGPSTVVQYARALLQSRSAVHYHIRLRIELF